jgi:hypothetical protein
MNCSMWFLRLQSGSMRIARLKLKASARHILGGGVASHSSSSCCVTLGQALVHSVSTDTDPPRGPAVHDFVNVHRVERQ